MRVRSVKANRIERVILTAVLAAVGCVWGGLQSATSAAEGQAERVRQLPLREKKIFAHYMGCFPVGAGGIAQNGVKAGMIRLRHDSPQELQAFGGMWRGLPLLPDAAGALTFEASAELEIKRALRAGIDGFAIDVLAGGPGNVFPVLDALFKVAEEKNYPFAITFCLDSAGGNPLAVEYLLAKHGNSPKLARRDGKVLFFGYQSVWQGLLGVGEREPGFKPQPGSTPGIHTFTSFGGAVRAYNALHPEIAPMPDREVMTLPDLRMTPEGWKLMQAGFDDLERRFKTPMYFQFSLSAFFHNVKGLTPQQKLPWAEAVAVLAGQIDSIGDFHKNNADDYDALARITREKGAEWGEPMIYQYENLLWSSTKVLQPGLDAMRECWTKARENQATLLQHTTWNDYNENTHLAPNTDTNYVFLDLSGYFSTWWKTGQQPTTDHDRMYLVYPKYAHGTEVYPFINRSRRNPATSEQKALDVLEVLTILTAPARVSLPGRSESWDAPAGLSYKQVPLQPGAVQAMLTRAGSEVLKLVSPEAVTTRPYREENTVFAWSTEEERQWKEDFGDQPREFLQCADYADADHDGLPNWFERYWFGKLADWKTATVAAAADDPDGDGLTNLQEYEGRTDPTIATTYSSGYVWDFIQQQASREVGANPVLDAKGSAVWYYLNKFGMEQPMLHDGRYLPCERYGWYPDQQRSRVSFSVPYNQPGAGKQAGDMSWEWAKSGDAKKPVISGKFMLTTGRYGLQAIGWKSPVAGLVRVTTQIAPQTGQKAAAPAQTVSLEKINSHVMIDKREFTPATGLVWQREGIAVKNDEVLCLVFDAMPGGVSGKFEITKLTVELLPLPQSPAASAGMK